QHIGDRFNNRLVASLGTTGFRFEIGDDNFLRFTQRSFELREDVSWTPLRQLTVRAGGDMRIIATDSEVRFPLPPQEGDGGPGNFSTSPVVELMETIDNSVASAYAAVDVRPRAGTTITTGLRLDYFDRYDAATLSPRIAIEQVLSPRWTGRLSLGSYSRGPLQAESFQDTHEPELATQYVLGVDYEIADGVKLQTSGFYTDRRALIVQDAVLAAVDPQNAYVNRGVGRSFGGEGLLRVRRDNFFGWIAYTLSRSDRVDGPMDERRLFDYDQTHNFIVVASYQLGRWQFGGRWQLSTGSPLTPITGSLYLADFNIYIPEYGEVNSDRLDTAHQLDLRIDYKWNFATWALSAYVDVTNVYANPRTLGFQYNFDFSERLAIEELPLVPALGVRGSF
ncbi:MAG: hypothetical protein AAGC55_25020, partial [Myxococcota bacterium]